MSNILLMVSQLSNHYMIHNVFDDWDNPTNHNQVACYDWLTANQN